MRRPAGLRARIALAFAGAVLASALFYAACVSVVYVAHEWSDLSDGEREDPEEEIEEILSVLAKLAGGMALASPLAAGAAAAVGYWLAGKALRPLGEAADRARAARAGQGEPLLPVRGAGDAWDQLALEVNGLLRDQRRAMAEARAFGSNAAHELRTPLAAMLGEVQVSLRRERTAEEYRKTLRDFEAETTRLGALVEALLVLSRADAGVLRAEAVPFDLGEVASEAAEAVLARHPRAGRSLRLEVEAAPARGDPLLSRRVLENLVENAVRHGGPVIEVRACARGTAAVAEVADDGPGPPAQVRARLFERFNRGEVAGEGFGLGLAIVAALTEAQGGKVRLEGAGPTRFVLELPGGGPSGGLGAPRPAGQSPSGPHPGSGPSGGSAPASPPPAPARR